MAGLEKTKGTRVPKLPRQNGDKFLDEKKESKQNIMPKETEEQRIEAHNKTRV